MRLRLRARTLGTPRRSHAACLAAGLALCAAGRLTAWEGHEWNQWWQVTTWEKPAAHTDQAGRRDLAPLLDGEVGATNRSELLRRWEDRRKEYAATIEGILGRPSNLKKPPVETRELGSEELEGYTRRHLMIRSEPEDWIPAYLLVPRQVVAPRVPAMLCLHQTVAQGKEEPCGIKGDSELAFAVELVKRGYVCLAPDAIGFGERIAAGEQPYHDTLAFFRRHPGWSCMGKMVWDTGRAVDFLQTLPMVDPQRIGSIGHSHGAYGTLFAIAFEPRISAAVASCGFTTFRSDPHPERWSHLTALMPQLGFYLPDVASIPFDWQHVLALAAPRPLFVWYATQDAIFPHTDNLDGLLRDVQTVYQLEGAAGALAWQAFQGPHQFPKAGREQAYRWLEAAFARRPAAESPAAARSNSASSVPNAARAKAASAFFPAELVARAQANARAHDWAAAIRDSLVAEAKPWMELSDDHLWGLMFGNTIRRSWQVWSDGYCPACRKPVPMYEWVADALNQPWKLRCPQCKELFPKNDFLKFYRSGLNAQGLFEPQRADRSLLFNVEHPAPSDPLRGFGVDDGEGYVADGKRWRFINTYLIFGQWKQAIVAGVRNLAAAYVATGDAAYAHKAGVLLDRVADFYPTFDFGKEGVMYEGPPRAGYVSTWHDACVEVQDLALAYDAVFEGLARDAGLVTFLAAKARQGALPNPKSSFADIQQNIEQRIFRDTLNHRPKIESNYPATDATITTLQTVLGWPDNRAEVLALLDGITSKATAVDGLTGEKGLTGYSVIAPYAVASLLGRYARADPEFMRAALARHPRLQAMYRFHLDTWCLGQYYPRSGDTGSFAARTPYYAGLPFTRNPGVNPSSYAFLWDLYAATGDKDFVRLLHGANGGSVQGLPYDLFAADPAGFQAQVAKVIAENGADFKLRSVNKTEWCLAILRSGEATNARAVWLDYDSGERHGHADGLTLGLFAKGLDLLPDFGYPPVQYGGWTAPRAVWYTQTAAHNTVAVDGKNQRPGTGKTTLWFEGSQFRVVRASAPNLIGGRQFERTIALVDISPVDSYVVDLLRVNGGSEHTRFLHGHFGRLTTQGLSLVPTDEALYGQVMRRFQRDSQPSPGWTADWTIEDDLHYLAQPGGIHLRQTELTRGAEAETAEAWVAVPQYGGTADAWVPSLLVRRRTAQPPLASTFAGVLEPYEGKPKLGTIRRLELHDAAGNPCPDSFVAIEIPLADGGRDLFMSANAELGAARPASITEPESGSSFEGDLCLVRFDKLKRPKRVLFCRGSSLRVGELTVRAKDEQASFEADLGRQDSPIVAGPQEAVATIEVGGVKLWPNATWRCGVARAKITPEKRFWMAGFAARQRPAEGTLDDLYVKALALEAPDGGVGVLVTADLVGIPKWLYDRLSLELQRRHHLDRSRLRFASSHTHSGPVLTEALRDIYPLDDQQRRLIDEYSRWLEGTILDTVAKALAARGPATLWAGEGKAAFAFNRRTNNESKLAEMLRRGEAPKGPSDFAVPVLAVRSPEGQLRAVVFGYAAHASALTDNYLWSADYAGVTQRTLESSHPGAAAMFFQGCGSDQSAVPRGSVELCQALGETLAAAVQTVLAGPMRPVSPAFRTAFEFIALDFGAQPSKAELETLGQGADYRARWARRLSAELAAGKAFERGYPEYPVQVWRLGTDQLWIALGGEVCVDYALRFKREFGAGTWVTGYANDVMAYIPSRRLWEEGGYQAGAFEVYGLPATRWCPDIEDRIAGAVARLVKQVQPVEATPGRR